jgi:putative oxidoreductase
LGGGPHAEAVDRAPPGKEVAMDGAISAGLLILRVYLGLLLFGHGAQKLFGWFGGSGVEGTRGMMHKLGYRPHRPMALLAGVTEAGGGLLLALGFLTPFAVLAIVGQFTNIVLAVHRPNGMWNTKGGIEFPLTLLVATAVIGLMGPGRISVDAAIGWDVAGWAWFAAEVGIGFVLGLLAMAGRRPPAPAAEEPTSRQRRRAA